MKFMQSVLSKMQKLSYLSFPLCFLSFVLLDFSFRYFYRFTTDLSVFSWEPVCFSLGWCLFLTALCALLPRLIRRIVMLVLSVFYSLLVLIHAGMFSVFGSFFSFSSLSFAGDGAAFFSWDYIHIRKILILCVLFSVLLMVLAAYMTPKYPKGKFAVIIRVAAAVIMILCVILIAYVHNSFQQEADAMVWDTKYVTGTREMIYEDFTDVNACMAYTGLYQFTFRDFCVTNGIGMSILDELKLTEYYENRAEDISGDNEMTNIFEGKNLIMVMMESIDTWMLQPEYMPNLYSLQEEGINLSNHYTPIYLYGATFNTEIMTLTGQIPTTVNLPSSAYIRNSFPISLPNLFKDKGYHVNTFHSSNANIYNRGLIHENLGMEKYWNWAAMEMQDYQLDSQMLNGYEYMVSDEQFFDFIITYSGHGPYTEEMGNIAAEHMEEAKAAVEMTGIYSDNADTMDQYIRAIAHVMETDEFVGGLMDRLAEDGHIEDTVVIFYGDHYGKYLTDTDFIKELKGITAENEEDLYHTPCIIYADGLEPMTVTKYTSTIDLLPTIVNLFGLNVERNYYVGDDIFGDKGGVVMMPDYSWFNGEVSQRESLSSTDSEIQQKTAEIRERISVSQDTFVSNYFANWNK